MSEETLNLPNANSSIKARGEKEQNVWSALDALYFDEKLPLRALTIQKIQLKRAQLEDGVDGRAKGDARGLSEMKIRWIKSRGIDEQRDPNQINKLASGNSSDPLFRVTQMVRAELQEELEEKCQALLDEAEGKVFSLSLELDTYKSRCEDLENKLDNTSNTLLELEPQYDRALKELVEKESMLKAKSDDYERQVKTTEAINDKLKDEFSARYEEALHNKEHMIKKLEIGLKEQRDADNKAQNSLIEINENQRTDYMQAKIELDNRILNLEDKIKRLSKVESEKDLLQSENEQLRTDIQTRDNQYRVVMTKLSAEINQQKLALAELHTKMSAMVQDKLAPISSMACDIATIEDKLNKILLTNEKEKANE